MSFRYGILFSIGTAHEYFGGGPSTDLAIQPTAECRRLLRRYRLFYRTRPGRAAVFATLRNNGTEAAPVFRPIVAIPNGTIFRFQALSTLR